tara:strand:- start:114 stop:317 length:204 start_codon:yes stop_codon:yes gene_type:complete
MMRKKPMLAYPVSDKPIDYNNTVFMQPKLDGVRCLIQAENYSDKGTIVPVVTHIHVQVKSGKILTIY